MTDKELQEAIDKAREFMNLPAPTGGLLHKSKEQTQVTLRELEKVQLTRASMATEPTIMYMEKV